jgi:L-asparaginase
VTVVHILTTGGTIASEAAGPDRRDNVILGGEALLERVRLLGEIPPVRVRDVARLASEDISPQFWQDLAWHARGVAAAGDATGIVLTHGTDTLEETAFFLDLVLDVDRPVVLTGAQRPLSDPDSDGPRNLLHAIWVASVSLFWNLGVLVVFNGQIHAARHVVKAHTTSVLAFASGEAGVLGTVEGDRAVLHRRIARRQRLWELGDLPRVDIIPAYPGADGAFVQTALSQGAQGLVVAAFGAGTLNAALREALADAVAAGVAVVIATRVSQGPAFETSGRWNGGGAGATRWGAILARTLPPNKVRILLMLALANGVRGSALVPVFDEFDVSESLSVARVPVSSD